MSLVDLVSGGRRALVSPDSFKGTFAANQIADAIADGLEKSGCETDRCPVADGGEGTMSVLLAERGGDCIEVDTHDPLGRPLRAPVAFLDDGATAIVESALASGLGLVSEAERDPEAADTRGTGEMIAAAVSLGARRVLVSLGGSATTDGGSGAVSAIQAAGGLRGVELLLLSDVFTPFERAAVVFAPQKGANGAAVKRLTERLHRLAEGFPRDPRGIPMTGAAGGLAGGLWAAFDCSIVSGSAYVLDALSFGERLMDADLVVTGEGRFDHQSLDGKIVGEIITRAVRRGVPAHVITGSCALTPEQIEACRVRSVSTATDLEAVRTAGLDLGSGLTSTSLSDRSHSPRPLQGRQPGS